MKIPRLAGVHIPMTTPFREDAPALDALRQNISRYCSTPLSGFLVLGSTGEAVALDARERLAVLEAAREAIPPERTFIAGIGGDSTHLALQHGRAAAARGADVALLSIPTYYSAMIDEEALYAHCAAVADRLEIPVLLYNVPKFTRRVMSTELIARLAGHGNIVGCKDSGGGPERHSGLLAKLKEDKETRFVFLTGHAPSFIEALQLGFHGGILGMANVDPELFCQVFDLVKAGKIGHRDELQVRVRQLSDAFETTGIGGIKKALEWRGLYGGPPRPPLSPPSPGQEAELASRLGPILTPGSVGAD